MGIKERFDKALSKNRGRLTQRSKRLLLSMLCTEAPFSEFNVAELANLEPRDAEKIFSTLQNLFDCAQVGVARDGQVMLVSAELSAEFEWEFTGPGGKHL